MQIVGLTQASKATQPERHERTTAEVIEAATALIAERGSGGFTLAEVAAAAGYSRGIVTHHFGSRENLLRAVMRNAQGFDMPEGSATAADWLASLVRAYLKTIGNRTSTSRDRTRDLLRRMGCAAPGSAASC